MNRAAIKKNGKKQFQQQYAITIGLLILYSFIILISNTCFLFFSVFVTSILYMGWRFFNLKVYRGEKAKVEDMFMAFSCYDHNLGGYLWMKLWTLLWTLLLVIPGIIKRYSYSMTPYILMDQPDVSACEALKLSMKMTKGYKWKIFIFDLSFIGYWIFVYFTITFVAFELDNSNLSNETLLILFLMVFVIMLFLVLYLYPYYFTAHAGIYEELKRKTEKKVIIDEINEENIVEQKEVNTEETNVEQKEANTEEKIIDKKED